VNDIYVQIPAYRDLELPKTLLDLYEKARHPERLRVCVLWQRAPGEKLAAPVRRLPRLEVIEVPCAISGGPNWARHRLQRRWCGEPFTLLLDSHQRFVRDWDQTVVAMYAGLEARGVKKPIISSYLPAYNPKREPGGRRKRPYKISTRAGASTAC